MENNIQSADLSRNDGNTMLGDVFLDALLKTLNSVYDKFNFIERVGSIYVIGYNKLSFDFEIPKKGGDLSIAYPEIDIVVIDKSCVEPLSKSFMKKRGGWKKEYSNKEWLKGHTAGCNIFADIVRSHQERV